MSTEDKKRYYWLKLDRNFFKKNEVKVIESMDNGKDYILFYLKLLCEATKHEGELRFSETVPYNERMLSVVTDTNIDIVRAAMEILTELNLIEILEDSTIYMTEMQKMIGSETHQTRRKREGRVVNSTTCLPPSYHKRTTEKEKEKEKEKDCSSNSDIWKMITPDEIDKLYEIYEEAGTLVQEVYEDVRDKGKTVDNAYAYIVGYAKNVGWKKVGGM